MKIDEFEKEILKLGIEFDKNKINQLEKYYNLLIDWNNKINLTSITDKKEVFLKHFYDSLTIAKVIDLDNEYTVLDVGTGAGFPGIVLKIFFPKLKIVLLDSLNKRVKFLNLVICELKLENIVAIHDRAEIYAHQHLDEFDIIVSRAVAKLNVLLEFCMPMLKVNGYFISQKGKIDEELMLSKKALKELNSKIEKIENFNLPIEGSNRNILKIRKISEINRKYPRKFDKIKKNPL